MQSLEALAIVRYLDDKKRYTLGPYLVVLGERAKEHLDYIKQDKGLKTFTDEEILWMDEELEKLKQAGYYVTFGEYSKGLCGIAAPIFSAENSVDMSIALIGFTSQFENEDLHAKGLLIKEAANEISGEIRKF